MALTKCISNRTDRRHLLQFYIPTLLRLRVIPTLEIRLLSSVDDVSNIGRWAKEFLSLVHEVVRIQQSVYHMAAPLEDKITVVTPTEVALQQAQSKADEILRAPSTAESIAECIGKVTWKVESESTWV
jgi:hypothetical protein